MNYFTPKDASVSGVDIEELEIPTVATDVRSTYFRLRAKRDTYAEDADFKIVTEALDALRSPIKRQTLRERVTYGPRAERGSSRGEAAQDGTTTLHWDKLRSVQLPNGHSHAPANNRERIASVANLPCGIAGARRSAAMAFCYRAIKCHRRVTAYTKDNFSARHCHQA